ncbi:hypothetical protein ALC57_09520 [Trachymyrmex cornetzi]|uniref:Uncharacterized protein n=1 Tax=Trachymyrmex cornetzi TaxID=471704 RepID=A0A195DZ58_9HYME|nr:hypothetical protein ALC57_09520 [Trachymyrmex cornetzi]
MPVIVFGVSPRRLYCELRDYRVFITLNDLSQARAAQLGSARLGSGASAFGHERRSENLIAFRMEFAPSLVRSVFKVYTDFTKVTRSMALASHDSDFLYEVSRSTDTTSRLGNQYKEVQDDS